MNTLNSIPVVTAVSTGNVPLLLREIHHALEKLLVNGEETLIDLFSLPFTPTDEAALLTALGQGEVRAEMDCLGNSHIRETAYAGVWLVEHLAPEGRRIAYHIAVCQVPATIKSEYQDMLEAAARLRQIIESSFSTEGPG